ERWPEQRRLTKGHAKRDDRADRQERPEDEPSEWFPRLYFKPRNPEVFFRDGGKVLAEQFEGDDRQDDEGGKRRLSRQPTRAVHARRAIDRCQLIKHLKERPKVYAL